MAISSRKGKGGGAVYFTGSGVSLQKLFIFSPMPLISTIFQLNITLLFLVLTIITFVIMLVLLLSLLFVLLVLPLMMPLLLLLFFFT